MKCKNCKKEINENPVQLCYNCFCDNIDIEIELFINEFSR